MPDNQIGELSEAVRENRGWFIALGVLLIIIGIIAIAYPLSATVTLKIFIGWMILIGGIAQVAHAFSTRSWGGFFWDLLIGLLYVFIGAWLAFFPLTGIITLTVMLALMFALEGIMKLLLGFTLRPADGWLWESAFNCSSACEILDFQQTVGPPPLDASHLLRKN